MNELDHKCEDRECCYFGQHSAGSCKCHQTREQMAMKRIETLRRRVVVLEQIIAEDLSPFDCSDELNKMIVVDILRARAEQKAAGA